MTGATDRAVRLSKALLGQGFLALPIGYPAVPENKARLRFFISSTHSEDDIRRTISAIGNCLEQIDQ